MSCYTDPAWDEYLSSGKDPTGGELEGYEEEACEQEPVYEDENGRPRSRVTPECITSLGEGEIFVFGSNGSGEHYGGAARLAYDRFGAEWGVGEGFTGQCYAINTMVDNRKIIKAQVDLFTAIADLRQDYFFYVTAIGCGIEGWTPKQIGPMFRKAAKLPNVALPMSFWNALKLQPIEPRFEADYVCLDVETANSYRSSICSIGVVWVKGRQIIDSYYSLVQPEPNWYDWHNQQVHGLGPADTNNARVFSEVWNELGPKIGDLPIVAHNASFDKGCLKEVFKVYGIEWIDNTFYDTLKGSRDYFGCNLPNHQLHTVASACGYDLRNHHHALADAEACAYIAMTVWEWNE